MKLKAFLVPIFLLLVSIIGLSASSITDVKAASKDIEVITDNETTKPLMKAIMEVNHTVYIELWHHSGGYWSYNDLIITDSQLNKNLSNADALAKAVNQAINSEINIDSAKYADLLKGDKVKVFVSSRVPDKKLSNLFYEKPIIKLEDNKIYFQAKPKYNFYGVENITFNDFIPGKLDVTVPLVDPVFGYNRYSIFGRSSSGGYGAANGYLNLINPYDPAPADSYKLAPSQIINGQGHLKNGFNLKATNGESVTTTHKSNDVSVGSGTFSSGGAVGIHFEYPITLSFYGEEVDDLSAHFEDLPSSVVEGVPVKVSVRVESTFKSEQKDVPYTWSIRTKNGNKVNTTFTGHASAGEGKLVIPKEGERLLEANFIMPKEDVHITFEINKDGKSPNESYLVNNSLNSGAAIRVAPFYEMTNPFELDYHILSRKVSYPLSDKAIQAQLILPRGSWNGPATGSLTVTNGTENLLRDFTVAANPAVNEYGTTIVRNPIIHTTFRRADFNDNPLEKKWLSTSLTKSGEVIFNGKVTRPYVYTEMAPPCNDKGVCTPTTRYGTASADFNSGKNTATVLAKVYHGQKTIEPKVFKDKIDSNTTDTLQKKLSWTNEIYSIPVIRWMHHMNEVGSLYNATAVEGRYERKFTQQASGAVGWSKASTMKQDYTKARTAARSRDYTSSSSDKAVFASDIDFKDVDYPIKSGYYFNPTGTYTFTVETVTFKETSADTQDHKALVTAVTDAFRYESDLMYINNKKVTVNLLNEPLLKKGNSYARKSGVLSSEAPKGVNGMALLNVLDRSDAESRYSKTYEKLGHSENSDGVTHTYWKEMMEGYAESSTLSSKNNYKYVEYVKNGNDMYKITEKTTVTIEINPLDQKVYTYAHMPNGEYTVKAWIDDVNLSSMSYAYKRLGTLKGIASLDEIKVSVKGSMYDDLNN